MTEFCAVPEDDIIALIEGGDTLTQIARGLDSSRAVLSRWIAADETRSARVMRARQLAAAAWEEKAEDGIARAIDVFELSKAKELAHHYRWRASKIAPKEYGEKIDLAHSGNVEISRIERVIRKAPEHD